MTDNRIIHKSPDQLLQDLRKDFPNSPKFDNQLVPALSPLAERLIEKRIKPKNSVKIDHLSFSFPLTSLRHCHKAGFAGTTSKRQTLFPLPPKIENSEGKSLEEIERHAFFVKSQLSDFYVRSLKIFIDHVLGFYVSSPRDKGFHGYTNSMTMKTESGVDVGFVGIGGQQDTVYIQISGTGCKYLFGKTSTFVLHHWLSKVLGISFLARVDLAKDDYDNVYNCQYAEKAYVDGIFRTGKGGKMPVLKLCDEFVIAKNGSRIFDVEMLCIGKRTSPVFWRIYNKKLEQKIDDDRLTWYRSEVELKKWTVDCLLDVDATFAGINSFAQSMSEFEGVRTKSMSKTKEACLTLASRVRWYRHSAGRALNDILKLTNGDISRTIGLLLPDDSVGESLGIPPTYKNLLNHVMEC